MDKNNNTVIIGGVEYVPKSESPEPAEKVGGMPYVLVRGDRSGVFVGYLQEKNGREVILNQARRLWYWDGASSISEIAVHGVARPENCKFPVEVSILKVLDAIEILEVTEKARLNIKDVPVWTQN